MYREVYRINNNHIGKNSSSHMNTTVYTFSGIYSKEEKKERQRNILQSRFVVDRSTVVILKLLWVYFRVEQMSKYTH